MRITIKHLKAMFARYVHNLKIVGQETTGMRLDNYPLYGGYKIISTDGYGSENDIFGYQRLSTREMYYALMIASQTLENIINKRFEK